MFGRNRPVVSVLRLNGVIGGSGPLRRGLSLQSTAGLIDRSFRQKRLKAVALSINSPGGSPVQSSLICNRIRTLARERDVPVITFVEDVAASGGYWLACAGDEIFADANSIVGSIGVISAGFGFVDAIERIGVERRVYTAGANKAMLDPFQPEDKEDLARLKILQGDIHDSFKELVRNRRGKKLKSQGDDLFTGEVWTGNRALEKGLIDGIGDLRTVLRDRFGEKLKLRVMGESRPWLRRRLGMSLGRGIDPEEWSASLGSGLISAMEERALWSRYGL